MPGFYERREGYKKADVQAPRFRKPRLSILSQELYKEFVKKHPDSTISFQTFKRIILTFNRTIRELVISERDGVELPSGVGYLFIGSCPKKKENPDVELSSQHDKKIHHRNWESNQYLCKIFYTNYGTKYRFLNREYWYFRPSRSFKREASQAYRTQWNMYLKISPFEKITSRYRLQGVRSIKVKKDDYNNRRVDFSDTQPD